MPNVFLYEARVFTCDYVVLVIFVAYSPTFCLLCLIVVLVPEIAVGDRGVPPRILRVPFPATLILRP